MAHQDLRFRLSLDLRNEWQPIFGAQEYGTFFMVYIMIKDISQVKNPFYVEGGDTPKMRHEMLADFKLQNFRGAITMGLHNKIDFNEKIEDTEHPYDVRLDIGVRPFTVNSKNEFKNITLTTSNPFEKGKVLETKLNLYNPPGSLYNSEEPKKAAYINPYNFLRDGEDLTQLGMKTYGGDDEYREEHLSGTGGGTGICGPTRCTLS